MLLCDHYFDKVNKIGILSFILIFLSLSDELTEEEDIQSFGYKRFGKRFAHSWSIQSFKSFYIQVQAELLQNAVKLSQNGIN